MNKNEFHPATSSGDSANLFEGSDSTSTSQQFHDMFSYPVPQYSGTDFINTDNFNGMPYQAYPTPYMPMTYGFMPYAYNYSYGSFYGGNKSYKPYKKRYSPGYTTTQKIYTKKPKQHLEVNGNGISQIKDDYKAKEEITADIEKLPHNIEKAKFFVIKSYSEEDIHKAVKHNLWCSTKEGNIKLHDAFVTANGEYPIFLLFSVNSSGYFMGVAQMKSHVDFDRAFEGWNQNHKWKGVFKLSWIYIKDIPNKDLRHLKNEMNEGKAVTHSRDCQEVPFDIGVQVLEVFEQYKNQTSILDDFEYYEMQEKGKI